MWAPAPVCKGGENCAPAGIRSRDRPARKRIAIQSTLSRQTIKYVNILNTTYTKFLFSAEKVTLRLTYTERRHSA